MMDKRKRLYGALSGYVAIGLVMLVTLTDTRLRIVVGLVLFMLLVKSWIHWKAEQIRAEDSPQR